MRQIGAAFFIVLFIQCSTVAADYSDPDKAYQMGDHARAFTEYISIAERGDVRAQLNVGWMYYYGEGVPQNKAMALDWYRKAAKQGDVTSMFNLAYAYEHGDGVILDLNESRRWYGKVAEQRNALEHLDFKRLTKTFLTPNSAQTSFAKIGGKKERLSVEASKERRIDGVASAVSETRRLTAALREEERKADIAASNWRKLYIRNSMNTVKLQPASAQKPVETAPTRMGINDESTLSPSANTKPGMFEYPRLERIRRRAEAGDTNAQVAMGWIYGSGKEIPVDKAKAVKWYRLAAAKDNLNAQLALGWIYFDGQGYERNLEESLFWYKKAAAQGNIKARQMLKKIERLMR
ncbi:MAG: tetratricopeptide repeat protein [Desulfuromonadaceae bacterium]|nr:tetratricopeptide repeat protein [Desulfuromonadaceae bacterium]